MRQGTLGTMLITPENLSTYLNNMILKTGSTLPLVVTPNIIYAYYNVLETMSCLIYSHVIRIFLRVPLKQIDHTYTLHEVLPVPTPTLKAKENFLYSFINSGMDFITISINE